MSAPEAEDLISFRRADIRTIVNIVHGTVAPDPGYRRTMGRIESLAVPPGLAPHPADGPAVAPESVPEPADVPMEPNPRIDAQSPAGTPLRTRIIEVLRSPAREYEEYADGEVYEFFDTPEDLAGVLAEHLAAGGEP